MNNITTMKNNISERNMRSTFFIKLKFTFNLILTYALFILAFNTVEISAQVGTDMEEAHLNSLMQTIVPVLGNHKFMPNSIVKDPFIKTYIRNSVGIGQALDLDIPIVEIGDDHILGLRGDLVFASLDFEYHHVVKEWFAVWGRFNLLARLGNDTQALLTQGVTAVTGFEFGWLFNLMRKDNTMLSLSLSLENGNATIINLLDFIDRIVEGDYTFNNSLVNKVQSLRGGSGLRFAWALSKLFGFYATGELLYGQSSEVRNESKLFYNVGGVLDFDLNAISDLPFGILLGYSQTNLQTSGDKIRGDLNTFFFRIGYNNPNDLSIGIESSINRIPVQSVDKTLNAGLTKLMLRYYFE
ncbi:MAG: hypothetical protein BMS9Abin39_0386 [Ignavibacteria bacterium]|nr:MAG: hypothetical protein BMS9Abin39_0386 [Ignavibacteria bacterium]